ncbi:MAG: D-alanine--D-alanine ligase [Firmicutes bacterium]|nr:D-alanine--D-alanine ligase [Bacillota bacterium]
MSKRVAVIMGGRSSEREISLKTGTQVAKALEIKGHEVLMFDLDEHLVTNLQNSKPDVVFIALHGRYGEDGCIQGMLEILGIPYVGSGVLASALAMDKEMSKKIFRLEGIPTPASYCIQKQGYEVLKENSKVNDIVTTLEKKFKYPMVVKPNSQGSTIGLSVVNERGEFLAALESAFEYDSRVLVEEYIKGTEITVGIIGNENPRILPVIEIVPLTGFYDYRTKYTQGLSEHIIPARIGEMATRRAKDLALRAHCAFGCRGMSRVDMIISSEDTPNEIYVLEVNTIPGMTETSLVPDAARAAGIDFPELVDMLVGFTLEDDSRVPDRTT